MNQHLNYSSTGIAQRGGSLPLWQAGGLLDSAEFADRPSTWRCAFGL